LHRFSQGVVDDNGIDNRESTTTLPAWAIALIVILILIIVGILLAIYLIRRRNKKLSEQLVDYNHVRKENETTLGSDYRSEKAERNQL